MDQSWNSGRVYAFQKLLDGKKNMVEILFISSLFYWYLWCLLLIKLLLFFYKKKLLDGSVMIICIWRVAMFKLIIILNDTYNFYKKNILKTIN